MSTPVESRFTYNVEDVNNSVRTTNALLRSVNAIRNTINDIKDLTKKFTFAKFFWFLIQLSRTYSSLRRLYNLTRLEATAATEFMGINAPATPKLVDVVSAGRIPVMDLTGFDVRVDAFLDNRPVRLAQLDISALPEKTNIMMQGILEEDAEITVNDAKEILTSRILHPEESTGDLSASIGWTPEVFGTRIFANMYYSWWVERGHDLFTGHHYMEDATARARLRLPEKIRLQLNGLISDGL